MRSFDYLLDMAIEQGGEFGEVTLVSALCIPLKVEFVFTLTELNHVDEPITCSNQKCGPEHIGSRPTAN